jgi:hypothetical protein
VEISTSNIVSPLSVHSLRTLIAELACLVRNTCRTPGATDQPQTFEILTTQTPLQRRAFDLLETITA